MAQAQQIWSISLYKSLIDLSRESDIFQNNFIIVRVEGWRVGTCQQQAERSFGFGIKAPLPGGKQAPINHKRVDHAEKTLGAMTSPDGSSKASIRLMQEKAQNWINSIKNGHLHCQNVWFSLKVQFWPRVGYSLCSSTATFAELENALHR